MQYNQCFIVQISIVIKDTLELRVSPYVITARTAPIHLSDQGIIIIAIVDNRK